MSSDKPVRNPLMLDLERPMPRQVGIIGAGSIGPDIGYYLKSALPDLTLVLVDIAPAALDKAVKRIEGYFKKGLARRKLTPSQAESVMRNLVVTADYQELADCDWVLEAATENLELKHRIFSDVERIVRPDALITSNTSSLPAQRLFTHLEHPERCTVTHFFAPAFRNPAVEVVAWDQADPQVIDWLRWFFAATGKVPLVTDDVLCFMLDRIFDNWCNEAAYLLDKATAAEVDSVVSEFVHAGPFFVLNLARGNPIIVETNTLQMEEGEHYRPASIFRSVSDWVTIKPGGRVKVAPDVAATVRDRMLGVLFSQSFDILDRDIGSPGDLNLGCSLALGFKQGPLDLMRDLGPHEVARIAGRFQAERPGMPGPRAEIASYQEFSRHLLLDENDGVKLITMRRPQAMNALDDSVTDELLALLRTHEGDPAVRGFVITGYGDRAFCAGADIGRFPEMLGDADASTAFARDCSRLLVHLDQMEKPVVAALNGMALGGGFELASRCHGLVADSRAWFQLPEVTLGIAPGIGGMVVPYRRWPGAAPILHDMVRLARRMTAEQALKLGIVHSLADGFPELVRKAVALVGELEGKLRPPSDLPIPIELPEVEPVGPGGQILSREVVGIIGRAVKEAAAATSLEEALDIGYRAFGASACTAAAQEGIEAFLKRQRPDFKRTG